MESKTSLLKKKKYLLVSRHQICPSLCFLVTCVSPLVYFMPRANHSFIFFLFDLIWFFPFLSRCNCHTGFTGQNCENQYVPCSPSPCQNGGVCKAIDSLNYECRCPPGKTRIKFVIGEFRFLSFMASETNCLVSFFQLKKATQQQQKWILVRLAIKSLSGAVWKSWSPKSSDFGCAWFPSVWEHSHTTQESRTCYSLGQNLVHP